MVDLKHAYLHPIIMAFIDCEQLIPLNALSVYQITSMRR
jgi:hypothetical protein